MAFTEAARVARHDAAAPVPQERAGHARLDRPAAHSEPDDQRAVRRDRGAGDTPSRPAHLRVPPGAAVGRRRRAPRASSRRCCGAPIGRPSTRRSRARDAHVRRPAAPRGRSTRASSAACSSFSPAPGSSSGSSGTAPAAARRRVSAVSDPDLASQLSFFLWSSLPDDALLDAAGTRHAARAAGLEAQVRRLLADRRSSALVENFAGQWLQLRNIRSVLPNSDDFPDFDDNLRQAMRRETELLFDSVMREDRSVLDLLTRRLHVRERAAGAALRHARRLRQRVPPRAGSRRGAPRAARARRASWR